MPKSETRNALSRSLPPPVAQSPCDGPAEPEPGPPARKAILIVDDHPLLRRGLAALIESEADLGVCAEATTRAAAIEAIKRHRPDLVIVDLALDGSDGLDLVKDMKSSHPEIPALVLTMYDEAVYAERALRAGARGYLTKQQLDDTVLIAIRRLLGGARYMSRTLEARLVEDYLKGKGRAVDSPLEALSDRELQVFRLIGQGSSTRHIAEELHLSVKTVESHCEHIKQKMGLDSARALARCAVQWTEGGLAG